MQRMSSRDSLYSITSDAPCSETFYLGEQCKLDENRVGIVAFVGSTKFAPGTWVGLALEKPEGKNDGCVNGERYFECKEKHGIFCRPSKLTKLCPASPLSPSASNGPPSPALSVARSIASTTVATNKTRSIYARECGFDIGDRVSIGGGKVGVLKFLDRISNELYAGVQLDRPLGCCDGVFNASAVKKCAKFAKPSTIEVRHTKTSTLRTWKGSQESLNSVGAGSVCSTANMLSSPKFGTRIGATKGTLSRNSEIEAGLKNCLQEKEAHLEHLSKELEQRRAETDYWAQQNSEFTARNEELVQLLEEAKNERADFERKFTELDERFEELTFQLDEANVQKSVFEAETIDLKEMCKELSEKLTSNASSCEVLQKDENLHTIDTTEFGVQVELLGDPTPGVLAEKSDLGTQTESLEEKKLEMKLGESQTERISFNDFSSQFCVRTSDANCEAFKIKCEEVGFQTDACDKIYESREVQTLEDVKQITFAVSSSQTDAIKHTEVQFASVQTDSTETLDFGAQVHYPSAQAAEVQTESEEITPRSITIEIGTQASEDVQSTGMQTETTVEPSLVLAYSSTQTDSVPEKVMSSLEVQTEQKAGTSTSSQTDLNKAVEHHSKEIQTLPEQPAIATSDSMAQTDAPAQRTASECQTMPPMMSDFSVQINPPAKTMSTRESQTIPEKANMNSSQVQTDPLISPKISTAEFGAQVKCAYANSEMQTISLPATNEEQLNNDISRGIVELDVSKLAASARASPTLLNGGGSRVTEMENMLKERDEKVEQLDSTVSFLNSIISEQTTTIGKLRKELENKEPSDSNDENYVDRVSNGMKTMVKSRTRTYCDFCQTFDMHETKDCSSEAERLAEINKHTTISPSLPKGAKKSKVAYRPFCDICEAFVHETSDCPNSNSTNGSSTRTSTLTKW